MFDFLRWGRDLAVLYGRGAGAGVVGNISICGVSRVVDERVGRRWGSGWRIWRRGVGGVVGGELAFGRGYYAGAGNMLA